jgi:hypothetical protein
MGEHRWSGWHGAYCLDCGQWDAMEYAIGNGWYDPCEDKWDTEEHRLYVEKLNSSCPTQVHRH